MTAPLWTSDDAARAAKGRATRDWQANGVSIDTRTIQPGDLFVALKDVRDGHDFVAQALENGASAALVSRIPDGLDENAPLLLVDDVLTGLEALGRHARARTKAKVVAITGSVGKTSTKEMLRTVLAGQGRVHAAEKSYNNHWGVPLTLARMPADVDFAVIEIGMNHPGEISPLAKMAQPHVALITTVAPAHLAAFESIEGISHEKAAIFDGLMKGGVAVYNGDLGVSPILRDAAKAKGARRVTFGEKRSNHHRVTHLEIHDAATVVKGRAWRVPLLYKVQAPGRHFGVNAMGALAVVHALKGDRALAMTSLGTWHAGAGRGQRQKIKLDLIETQQELELIDDGYNSNPASLEAALEVLAAATPKNGLGRFAKGRRVAYLGDMKELGATEKDQHRAIASLACTQAIDVIHCVGPLMRELWSALQQQQQGHWAETSDAMADRVSKDLDAGDIVLVKGSLSMRMARVVDAISKMGQSAQTQGTK